MTTDQIKDATHDRLTKLAELDPDTGCWLCKSGVQKSTGLGTIKFNGKMYTASRMSAWVYIGGFDLDDRNVLVRRAPVCQRSNCINYEHLIVQFRDGKTREVKGEVTREPLRLF